jgi:hypothetical protein
LVTLVKTVKRISNRSAGVRWDGASNGLALVLTQGGYALTARPDLYPESLPARVVVPCEDGSPMPHGHILTPIERECAIRAIMAG